MKTKRNHFGNLLAVALIGGWIASGPDLLAQEKHAGRDAAPSAEARGRTEQSFDPGKVRRMLRELAELKRAGKHEEARRLTTKIQEMAGSNPQVMEALQKTMQDRKPEPKSDRRVDKAKGGKAKPAMAAREKIRHLNQAAEHLQAAGYEEYAAKARGESRRMEAEIQHANAAAEGRARSDRPGDGAAILEEMKKLRREMEELRREVMSLKVEAGKRPPVDSPGMRRPWMGRQQ